MHPCFQGNISDVSLLFPLIRPHKVVHINMKLLTSITHGNTATPASITLTGPSTTTS